MKLSEIERCRWNINRLDKIINRQERLAMIAAIADDEVRKKSYLAIISELIKKKNKYLVDLKYWMTNDN